MKSLQAPTDFYKNLQTSNIHDAFVSKSLSIGGISRAFNDNDNMVVRALLNIMVGDIIKFMNVGKSMTGPQLTETVGLIVKHYHHLKPEDFKLCFEGVKKGNYGPLYDRIDGQVILSWFKAYDSERDYIAAEIASNRNEEYKMQSNLPLLPDAIATDDVEANERFRTNMAKLKQQLAANKEKREAAKKAVAEIPRNIDPMAIKSQQWLQQFDDLHYLRKVNTKAGRFIKRYGRTIDVNAYLEHKHWQWVTFSNPVKREEYRKQLN